MERHFITRTELHGVPSNLHEDVYGELHKQMAKRKFHTTILGDNKIVYDLPRATYLSFTEQGPSQFTAMEVHNLALEAIAETKRLLKIRHPQLNFTGSALAIEAAGAGSIVWGNLAKTKTP